MNGWDFVADAGYGAVAVGILAGAYVNAHRDTKKHPTPIAYPMPWPEKKDPASVVTDAEREALVAQLARRSAIAA